MFVRKKSNASGSVSIQIIDKSNKTYKVFKSLGSSKDPDEIKRLVLKAEQMIEKLQLNPKQEKLLPIKSERDLIVENFAKSLSNSQIHTIGPELIFGKLFESIGFDKIKDQLFRHLVITRLAYPTSKLKTQDYLYRYKGISIDKHKIYRFLDNLQNKHKDQAEEIAFNYTKERLKQISVVFYDMTTLYFEAEDEDDLRKVGFSKDGKFQKPQIMLGLLVGKEGLPIGYDIFEGNTFEGHTLMPILGQIQKKYEFSKPTVIADAALLSHKNLNKLSKQKYQFIIGARIKNEGMKVKEQILKKAKNIKNGESFVITKTDGLKLVVSYAEQRAKKDQHNRERGLRKLRQKVKSGILTKESINNRGYNKFLKLSSDVLVGIDEKKVKEDQKWDGLKGYITNTTLKASSIIDNYKHLWQIEKAFRISKTDLKIRPIYHRKKDRIEAHICIAFVAYTIYKELERLLYKHKVAISAKRAAELTHNMYELEYTSMESETEKIILKMDNEQQQLYNLIYRVSQ